jgi:hypothetical protein
VAAAKQGSTTKKSTTSTRSRSSTATARRRTSNRSTRATSGASVPRGRTADALTAAAARHSQQPVAVQNQRIPQWQLDSLAYYDQIGIVRYAAQFWARGLAKIRFYAAEKDDKGEVKETNDEEAIAVFERVQDPMGGRTQIASTYGQLRFCTGECNLIWTPETADEPEMWEIVSMLELRKLSKRAGKETWHRIYAPGLNPKELVEAGDDEFEPMADEVIVYRLWKRHPAYSMMADAPMRSVLADCEEIVRTTHTINARLISRLSGPGILVIPDTWKVKPLPQVAGEENPEEDPFQVRLTQAMIAAIGTPGSAESVAPIVVRVPADDTDKWKLIKIWNPDEVIRELDTREKAMHRFAVGVDMPPGKVEGIEGTTHWNAWAIDKEGMEHLLPVAQDFANDIAMAYFRPALRQLREDWSKFVVGFDAAAAVTNPDEFGDALKLYEARAVGKKYLRAAGNATDRDKMPDEELEEALFVATSQRVEISGGKLTVVEGTSAEEPATGEETEQEAPTEPTQEEIESNGHGDLSISAYLALGAAEMALEEIRARVGRRLVNHLAGGKCRECVEAVRSTPAALIAMELGEELISEQGVDLSAFAEDAGETFAGYLERGGVSALQARALQELLEIHASTTIYEESPGLPTGFVGRVKALQEG